MENEICRATAQQIADELNAGIRSRVDPRPCIGSVIANDPRFGKYQAEGVKAHNSNDISGQLAAYEKIYTDIIGPAQTNFWKSIVQKTPNGICKLGLNWSKEYPGIIDHVEITCDSRPIS